MGQDQYSRSGIRNVLEKMGSACDFLTARDLLKLRERGGIQAATTGACLRRQAHALSHRPRTLAP